MAKKNDKHEPVQEVSKNADQLKQVRDKIDQLDRQILKLINERAGHAGEIGRLKNLAGEEIFSPVREEEVLKHVLALHQEQGGPLDPGTIRAVFREIMSGSRALQKVLKVAYLGPEFSFSRVADTLDMFLRMPQVIISNEVRLQVHHNLMAQCDQQDIRRIYSKPQALSQCRNWLSKNVPHAKQVEVSSTATAAELAQREPGAAAVASRQAASRYGLRLLFSDIEDYPDNETRFAIVGRHKCGKGSTDKTSIVFRISHAPGALVGALDLFREAKINLTWIESFPARSGRTEKLEYLFFIDLEGHQDEPKVAKALKGLASICSDLRILGSYPVSPMPS